MLANEALEVLALRPGASSVQIKEAYRDLVKVWHPDRFGSDARLRQKAGEKLQQINEAYRVLQSDGGASGSYRTAPTSGSSTYPTPSYSASTYSSSYSTPVAAKRRRGPRVDALKLFYGCVGVAVIVYVGIMAMVYAAERAREGAPAVVVANVPSPEARGGVVAGSAPEPGGSGRPSASKGGGTGSFGVRSLSEAETSRLEEACEPQRERLGQTAYQVCVAAQVALMTNPAGRPDLSALNGAERESIESACSEARRVRGVDGYDRCLTVKMAEWAAEPARPRLSVLNDADRSSVELACRGAKEREGPAAYDRCLVRFVKSLAEAR